MSQRRRSRPRPSACLLAGGGTVAAAAVGHTSSGGALPSPMLLGALAVGLALALAVAPRRLRTLRAQLFVAALAQPPLHVVFELWSSRAEMTEARLGVGVGMMLLAHGIAAVVAAWLLRDAERLILSAVALADLLLKVTRRLVRPVISTRGPVVSPAPMEILGRFVERSLRRRGPPGRPAVSFSS